MLKALRDRDAGAAWEATESALPPEPPVRPVVEPLFSPTPGPEAAPEVPVSDDFASDGAAPEAPAWRTSRAATGRSAPRLAQEQPDDLGAVPEQDAPLTPVPDPFGEDPAREGDPGDDADMAGDVAPIARTPNQLRRIGEILPYFDYEPDPDVDDPCLNLCPRPDGLPCKQYGEGEMVPACPEEVGLGDDPFVPRSIAPSVFAWKASNVHYNPLYFEDVPLERYGHTYGDCVQPFVSLGKFGVQLVGLPYQMALDPPHKKVYPLGYYRPGEPAPKLFYQIPLNARAAAVTAGFYSGLGVILP